MEKEWITSAVWKVMKRKRQSFDVVKKEVSQTELASRSDLIPGTSERGQDGMDRTEGSRAWSLQYCSICGKALRCETGSEESRKEERTLAGNCQGGCGTDRSRGIVPQVQDVMSFQEAMNYAKELDVVLDSL